MPSFSITRRVAFTPRQMFDLVADVEKYPQFLPLCEALVVKQRERGEGGTEIRVSQMTVGYMAIRETFTSRVVLDAAQLAVLARVVPGMSGPFDRLENRWGFREAAGGCDVDFSIDYALKSLALQMLVGGLFDRAFRRYAEAFEARARAVYGARS